MEFDEVMTRLIAISNDLDDLWYDLDDGEHLDVIAALTIANSALESARVARQVELLDAAQ